MEELKVGVIYKCSDGEIRRLDKIEDNLLHYSVPIDIKGHAQIRWMTLSGTRRWEAEPLFVNCEIITENDVTGK